MHHVEIVELPILRIQLLRVLELRGVDDTTGIARGILCPGNPQ